jgi:hypothetical protein
LRAELEHRAPIEPGADVEVVIEETAAGSGLWLREGGSREGSREVYASATIEPRIEPLTSAG